MPEFLKTAAVITGAIILFILFAFIFLVLVMYIMRVMFFTYKVIRCPFGVTRKDKNFFLRNLALVKWILVEGSAWNEVVKVEHEGTVYYICGEETDRKRLDEYNDRYYHD